MKMPCQPCPDADRKPGQGEVHPAIQDKDVIQDPELRRIWRAMRDLNISVSFFRAHFTYVSCERCREIAQQLLILLESYLRLLSNAENYKFERLKLVPGIEALAKQFGLNLEEMLKTTKDDAK